MGMHEPHVLACSVSLPSWFAVRSNLTFAMCSRQSAGSIQQPANRPQQSGTSSCRQFPSLVLLIGLSCVTPLHLHWSVKGQAHVGWGKLFVQTDRLLVEGAVSANNNMTTRGED